MKVESNVIQFPSRTSGGIMDIGNAEATVKEVSSLNTTTALDINSIYPLGMAISSDFRRAIEMVEEAKKLASNSLDFYRAKDFISSDQEIQKLNMLLPEIFCFRDIGDGFGEITRSIWVSLKNASGNPLNESQITALSYCFYKLAMSPQIEFGEAVGVCDRLEEAGFNSINSELAEVATIVSTLEQQE